MKAADNPNPPAFPRPGIPTNWAEGCYAHEGMTLRDWFAGQALAGLMACPTNTKLIDGGDTLNDGYAIVAYQLADKMLRARQPSAKE